MSERIDGELARAVMIEAVKLFGETSQTDIAIEEMSELTKEIIKSRRKDHRYCTYELIEELVDVDIMLGQLQLIAEKNFAFFSCKNLKELMSAGTLDFEGLYCMIYMKKIRRLKERIDARKSPDLSLGIGD